MNKAMASLIFGKEMLFKIEGHSTQPAEDKTEQVEEKEVQKVTKIAVNKPTLIISQTLNSVTKKLLENILNSVDKNIDGVHLTENFDLTLYDLNQVKEIILFGLSEKPGSSRKKYSWYEKNEKHILFADSLEVINNNLNNEKRLLWNALKILNTL